MKHENIVPLLGLWLDYKRFKRDEEPSPCPVAPWMGGGNLRTYLSYRPQLPVQDRLEIVNLIRLLYLLLSLIIVQMPRCAG